MRLVEMPALRLQPGMFVAELDRPWLETPFALQGFVVKDEDDVLYVAKHVDTVFVDADYAGGGLTLPAAPPTAQPARGDGLRLKADFAQAKADFRSAAETLDSVFENLRLGDDANIGTVKAAVRPLIESVFRNQDAVAALTRLKLESGEYRYNHGIAMAVWSAILGRHLGLDRDELERLVTGCAMCDIGMTRLPKQVVDHERKLNAKQTALVRRHPQLGVKLLKQSEDADLGILSIVESHHERYDGSGYPHGLKDTDIPLLARIAGLVDSYDAMITPRTHANPRTSFDAVQELLDGKNRTFQGALVEQFVQAIGLFPVGSLVELNSGEIAIVVTQNASRRLRPEVMIVLDADKQVRSSVEVLDLAEVDLVGERARWIARELPFGSHGVNANDYFV